MAESDRRPELVGVRQPSSLAQDAKAQPPQRPERPPGRLLKEHEVPTRKG